MESAEVHERGTAEDVCSALDKWCEDIFSRLVCQNGISNIALFVWVDDDLKLAASQTQDVFNFYSSFKPCEEYSGYYIDWESLANKHEHQFSFISELPFNGGWQQDGQLWEHAVIPLYKREERLGYLLVESITQTRERALSVLDFSWLLENADTHLKCKILAHRLNQQNIYRRKSELDFALDKHTLASQLTYLQNLHEISLRFTKATTIHSLCRIAVELGRDKLQVDRMGIFLCDMESHKMWGTWGTDPQGNVVDRSEFCQEMPKTLFMEEAFTKKNQLIVKENVPLYFGKEQVGIGWNIMMAMWNGDECIGWLAGDNLLYGSPLDEPKKEALKLLAASVSQKIVKVRETEASNVRFDELISVNSKRESELKALKHKLFAKKRNERWMNLCDADTGLPNEQALQMALPGLFKQARKEKQRVAAIAIDIDCFDGYRKFYGESAATNLVKKVADVLERQAGTLLPGILSYQSSGTFFLLLLHDDDLMLREVAENMVHAVYHLNIPNKNSPGYQRVTLSVGMTLTSISLFTQKLKIMKRAEKLKTTAVKLGQNRVCLD
ncbi:GGDEF domain-containing protein [Grimontia kaedaensis]|uniref:GGDEF domain-containing protein n=1 Tax=Grimontia kaedaensis TaxID=2872157 RepID=A0ABY4WZ10_9GAMM|nr:GGDEF domain-containing protein [Grimontia kaedaensis]USH04211.1 GGDEF domain-containing protein [Grimontia kaedaensis]